MRISVKFNPALRRRVALDDRRLWLLRCVALRIERHANPLWRFEVYHRRLMIALLGAAAAGYLAAATALWWWLDRNPHNQAAWTDVVQLPWRWDELRSKRGDTAIATARERLRERDYVEAFHFLRTGLGRSPGNVEGRLLLAQLLAGYEPQRALAVMEEGIPHAGADPRFLGALFAFYAQFQVRDHALAQAARLRQQPPPGWGAEAAAVLTRAEAQLLALDGRPDEALALLGPTPDDPLAALVRADALLRAGRAAEARDLLAATRPAGRAGSIPELARREAEAAIALGDADGLRSALRRWRAHAPDQPAPYLYGFAAWHRLNRGSFRDAAEREYYELFGGNDGALQAFAALAVSLDLPEVVERARQVARAHRASAFAYHVHLTEIALRRGRFEEAVRLLRDWEAVVETLQPAQRFYPEFIKRLARQAFAGGDAQADALIAHLAANRGQAQLPVWLLASQVLERAGHGAALVKLLRPARTLFPHTDELREREERLAQAPIVSVPVVAVSPAVPAAAGEALRQLDGLLQEESLAAARDLLRAVRDARPAWLDGAAADIDRRELELAFATLDPLTTRSLVRQYLDRHRSSAAALALVELARNLADRQRLADARMLIAEILKDGAAAEVRAAVSTLDLPDDLAGFTATAPAALATLDRWISSSHWSQAERLLAAVHERNPAWAAGEQTGLRVREIQVRLGLGQRPLALTAFKDLVIKPGAPRSAAFKLVRDYIAAGEQEVAVVLAREISRLLPDDPAAEKLLKEARSPRPAV